MAEFIKKNPSEAHKEYVVTVKKGTNKEIIKLT